jgi:CorA-like Mg2+ transporter protein
MRSVARSRGPPGLDTIALSPEGSSDCTSQNQRRRLKQPAVIATIFLPLAWLTGFFDQNFGYLVKSIGGWETFFGFGAGTELVALAILLVFFTSHRAPRGSWRSRKNASNGAVLSVPFVVFRWLASSSPAARQRVGRRLTRPLSGVGTPGREHVHSKTIPGRSSAPTRSPTGLQRSCSSSIRVARR